jgi:tRNA(Ile)-lysidine synthase
VTSPANPDPSESLEARARHALDVLAGDIATPSGRLGIAVSGGSDSTALLRLALAWARGRDARIEVATVDHGLRPEAATEARRVERLCASLGVPHATLRWRPGPGAVDQARARRARHTLLANWAHARGLQVVALGHTEDDRIETLLLRIRAGSGWYGLASPLPQSPSPAWPEGAGLRLIRPLLGASRSDLRRYLVACGQDWIEDPTNSARRHERVRIRERIAEFDDSTRVSLVRSSDGLARLRADVLRQARETLVGDVAWTPEGARLSRLALVDLPPDPRYRLVEALLLAVGGDPTPPRRSQLESLLHQAADRGGPFRPRTLSHAVIRIDRGDVWISTEAPRAGSVPADRSGARPQVERARALLADPGLDSLRTPVIV